MVFSASYQGDSREKESFLRAFLKTLCAFWLVSMSSSALAEDGLFRLQNLFTPIEGVSDISIKILQAMFGKMGDAFSTTMTGLTEPGTMALMNAIFSVFNACLIVIVGIVISYSIIFSTIGASQDGQGMQRKDGPMGVLRMVVGTSALVPGFGGYSAIQVLVMTVVVYGVNFANRMWKDVTLSFATEQSQLSSGLSPSELLKQKTLQRYSIAKNLLTKSKKYNMQSTSDLMAQHCATSSSKLMAMDVLAMQMCMVFKTNMDGRVYRTRLTTTTQDGCKVALTNGRKFAMCFGSEELPAECGVVEAESESDLIALKRVQQLTASYAQKYSVMDSYFDKKTGTLTTLGQDTFEGCNAAISGSVNALSGSSQSSQCKKDISDKHIKDACSCYPQEVAMSSDEAITVYESLYKSGGACSNKCSFGADLARLTNSMTQVLVQSKPNMKAMSEGSGLCGGNMFKFGWASAGQYFSCLSNMLSGGSGSGASPSTASSSLAGLYVVSSFNPLCRRSDDDQSNPLTSGKNRLGTLTCCDKDAWVKFYNKIFPNVQDSESNLLNRPYAPAWLSIQISENNNATLNAVAAPSSSTTSISPLPSMVSQPVCRSSQFIAAASQNLTKDLPSMLTSVNPYTSWLTIGSEVFNQAPTGSDEVVNWFKNLGGTSIPLTWGLINAMQSMYMTIEALTGLRVFSLENQVYQKSDYEDAAKVFNSIQKGPDGQITTFGKLFDPWCRCVIASFTCGAKGDIPTFSTTKLNQCTASVGSSSNFLKNPLNALSNAFGSGWSAAISPPKGAQTQWNAWRKTIESQPNGQVDFLATMHHAGCLTLSLPAGDSTAVQLDNMKQLNYKRAGLFGMSFLRSNGVNLAIDPLGNLANIGKVMLQASVYYFIVTIEQSFKSLSTMAVKTVSIFTTAKIFAGGIIAFAEPGGIKATITNFLMTIADTLAAAAFDVAKMALDLFLPLGSAIASLLFVQGIILGVYLPFVAFFYYLFGVLGWLMSVVEAMVAAPLVALGVTHPEGHDLLGAAEQSTMLLMGVFLRPVAMIMGLFFAIILSQVVLSLINEGFLYIIAEFYEGLMSTNNAVMTNPLDTGVDSLYARVLVIATLALFMVYSYVAYTSLDMSFSLIWQIPDRILRWIGGQDDGIGRQSSQSAQQIQQETQSLAQKGSQGASQSSSSTPQGSSGLGSYEKQRVQGVSRGQQRASISSSGSRSDTSSVSGESGGPAPGRAPGASDD